MTLVTGYPLYAQEGLVNGKAVRKPTGNSLSSAITTHAYPEVKECQCCFLQKFYVVCSSQLHNCIAKHGNRQFMKR